MALYRGPGGAGDATADSSTEAEAAVLAAAAAAVSETNAANSAAAASASAAQAAIYETNAGTNATNAGNAQTAAEAAESGAQAAETAAAASAAAALVSENAAAASAAAAALDAIDTAADAVATAADAASTAADAVATAADAVSTAADNAAVAALYDAFDDRYLGSKASAPALDNDGNALLVGALYWDSVLNQLFVWSGATWQAAYFSSAGVLLAANNLSDLTNAATARTNLGLGSAAVEAASTLLDRANHTGTQAWSTLTGTPTTLAGYGITDALPLSGGTVSGALTVTGVVTSNTNFKVAGGASQVMEFGTLGSSVYLQSYGAAFAATPIDFYTGTTIKMTLSAAGDLSVTGAVTGSNLAISNWNTAYGWGNHATAGYLTSETSHADVVVDGDFASNGILKRTALGVYGIVTDNSANWDTAYGWGNHSGLYLPLTGGTLTGALNGTSIALSAGLTDTAGSINLYRTAGTSYLDWSSGQALAFSTVTSLGGAGRSTKLGIADSGVTTIYANADAGLYIDCSSGGTWAGLNMKDASGNDNIWFHGSTGTFAIGGGGSTGPSGKKLHVDGGQSIGANADATATPTNGLYVEGNIESDGSIRAYVPLTSQSAAYTLVSGDGNTIILHPAADTTARTFTIPANSSVAYPVGTVLTFINQNAAGTVTIAITTDTMRLAGAGTTGSRTLAANGIAVATKITTTEWIISGTGLT